jgi:hypothetical protein
MKRGTLAAFLAFLMPGVAVRAHTREVYVWQRQFDAEVAAALRAFQPEIDGACVLAAEAGWKNGKIDVVRPTVDFRALATLEKPVGLALRITAFSGRFSEDDAATTALVALARERIAAAKAEGLTVSELQVDFDCAESKLAGYRGWLRALRKGIAPVPLVFTALPVWLKHADFEPLARAADGYVLQVHSLERPTGPQATFALCDPVRAMAWARQADVIGVPFRVALPTYGYVLAFDAAGKFIGMAAEGPRRAWPGDAQLRVVRANAVAMAELARTLQQAGLPHCRGVIWFRLPVPRDRMNWDAVTFSTVLRNEMPASRLVGEVERPEPGLVEVVIANRGQTTEPLPTSIELRWPADARVLAADGIGGFRLEIRGGQAQGIVRAANVPVDAFVAPGGKARIAWLRFAHEVSVEVSLPAAP